MQNFFLILHLLIALALILTVLLQRSEGGGLGIGGGGGSISGRPPASPVAKFTWWLAMAFLVTSLSLNWLARSDQASVSVIDQLGTEGVAPGGDLGLPPADGLLPPPPPADGLVPPPPAD